VAWNLLHKLSLSLSLSGHYHTFIAKAVGLGGAKNLDLTFVGLIIS